MPKHINYYQLYQLLLNDTNSDITMHTNNNIIHGIITLMDEMPFNEWYADVLDEMETYTKLSLPDILKVSSSKLHQSLKNKPVSNVDMSRSLYTNDEISVISGSTIIDDMLYHAMTLKSSFWDMNKSFYYILKNS